MMPIAHTVLGGAYTAATYVLSTLGSLSVKTLLASLLALSIIRTSISVGSTACYFGKKTLKVISCVATAPYHIFKAVTKRN